MIVNMYSYFYSAEISLKLTTWAGNQSAGVTTDTYNLELKVFMNEPMNNEKC